MTPHSSRQTKLIMFCCFFFLFICWRALVGRQQGHDGELSDEEDKEGSERHGHDKVVTVGDSEPSVVPSLSSEKSDGSRSSAVSGGGGGNTRQSSAVFDSTGAPAPVPRTDRGRWLSLPRLWGRRRSTGGVDLGSELSGIAEGRATADEVSGDDGAGVKNTRADRPLRRRTTSAPTIVGPPTSKPVRVASAISGTDSCTSQASAATSAINQDGADGISLPAFAIDAEIGDSSRPAAEARDSHARKWTAVPVTSGSRRREQSSADEDGDVKGRKESGDRSRLGDRDVSLRPPASHVVSAPFLVARISGVRAELKEIKWSVKQTHFPHLKTSGSLEATVSGLTIELELDAQDLSHLPSGEDGGTTAPRSAATAAAAAAAGAAAGGDVPKGLRLTRLRVSVRTVKVHVSNSALSAVYNLAASAFEAPLKRYVVENVEGAVRRNLTALLALVNNIVIEKWNILSMVGAGGSEDKGVSRQNTIDKVLAASLSRHVMWAAREGSSGSGNSSSNNGSTVPVASGTDAARPGPKGTTAARMERQQQKGRGAWHGWRGERTGSGSGSSGGFSDNSESGDGVRGEETTDGEDAVSAAGSGFRTGAARQRQDIQHKRSFRHRWLGAVGKTQSAEDVSRLPSSHSQFPADVCATALVLPPALPPLPPSRRAVLDREQQQQKFGGETAADVALAGEVQDGESALSRRVAATSSEVAKLKASAVSALETGSGSASVARKGSSPPWRKRNIRNGGQHSGRESASSDEVELRRMRARRENQRTDTVPPRRASLLKSWNSAESIWTDESRSSMSAVA